MADSARAPRPRKAAWPAAQTGTRPHTGNGGQLSPISATTSRILGLPRQPRSFRKDIVVADINSITPPTAYRPLHMVPQSSLRKAPQDPKQASFRQQKSAISHMAQKMLPLTGKTANRSGVTGANRDVKSDSPPLAFRSQVRKTPLNCAVAAYQLRKLSESIGNVAHGLKSTDQAIENDMIADGASQIECVQRQVHQPHSDADVCIDDHNAHQAYSPSQRTVSNSLGNRIGKEIAMAGGTHQGNSAGVIEANDSASAAQTFKSHTRTRQDCPTEVSLASDYDGATHERLLLPKKATFRPSTAALEYPHILLGLLEHSGKQVESTLLQG